MNSLFGNVNAALEPVGEVALAATAGQNLRLHHILGRRKAAPSVVRVVAALHAIEHAELLDGNAALLQQMLALVLEQIQVAPRLLQRSSAQLCVERNNMGRIMSFSTLGSYTERFFLP